MYVNHCTVFTTIQRSYVGIHPDDVEYLIKEATPGTDVHQAINEGLALVTNHPDRLLPGGDFNIWPFVTSEFFRQLHFKVSIDVRSPLKI